MTDQSQQLPPPTASATDDRVLPIVAYACYLGGLVTGGVTPIVGVIIAHAGKASASPMVRTHYEFLIRTFWISLLALIVGGVAWGVGFVLSFIIIGLPLLFVAWAFLGLVCAWFAVRSIVGLVYIVQNEPYPRPYSYLI